MNKTCGTCRHWVDTECPDQGFGRCYGAPPSAQVEMRPDIPDGGKPIIISGGPGGQQMVKMREMVRSVYPSLPRGARACGAYEAKPDNGEAT